jgi:hypothetical protein
MRRFSAGEPAISRASSYDTRRYLAWYLREIA